MPGDSRWLDMPRQPIAGDSNMPRVAGPSFGASERFAVAPGDEANGIMHMPSGQIGHPLSPFFRRGHDAWVKPLTPHRRHLFQCFESRVR